MDELRWPLVQTYEQQLFIIQRPATKYYSLNRINRTNNVECIKKNLKIKKKNFF